MDLETEFCIWELMQDEKWQARGDVEQLFERKVHKCEGGLVGEGAQVRGIERKSQACSGRAEGTFCFWIFFFSFS